jgi:hypothetical protein
MRWPASRSDSPVSTFNTGINDLIGGGEFIHPHGSEMDVLVDRHRLTLSFIGVFNPSVPAEPGLAFSLRGLRFFLPLMVWVVDFQKIILNCLPAHVSFPHAIIECQATVCWEMPGNDAAILFLRTV